LAVGRDIQRTRALLAISGLYIFAFACGLVTTIVFSFSTPLVAALAADLVATFIVFIFSRISGNSSLYDPYWSVTPPAIAVYWLLTAPASSWSPGEQLALVLVLGLLFIWALRLTWNWVRRWKGPSDEDWRYAMLKSRFNRFDVPVDLLGIHLFPTVQVFLGLIPLYYFIDGLTSGALGSSASWVALSGGVLVMIVAVIMETVADRQLAEFRRTGKSGLLQTGIWGSISHPNYMGEILFWWGLWAASLSGGAPLWSILGPAAMTLMFLFVSVPMMDRHLDDRSSASA
jgi:steroid 5-alpha reductase family enzyme